MSQLPDLTDRVALVTGSSRGLGAATARRLADAGADVIVTYRRKVDEAEAVADEVRDRGRRAWTHKVDMAKVDRIEALFEAIAEEPGGIDILVANAAATSFVPLMEASVRQVERTYAISSTGFLRAVQLAVPMMEARGGGHIVGISGADTRTYIPAHGILAGAKASMETMVRYLACEVGDRGITVTGLNPGTIMGESIQMMLGAELYAGAVEVEERSHPLRAAAGPDDIADPVVLLCSDAARWMNGTVADADGGSVFAMCGRWMSESAENAMHRAGLDESALGPSVEKLD
ncbi:MAG: SDR family oxidoreductase [Actinomycetota bacterium]